MRHHEDETMKADRGGGGKMRVVAAWPTVFVKVVDAGREGSTVTGHRPNVRSVEILDGRFGWIDGRKESIFANS